MQKFMLRLLSVVMLCVALTGCSGKKEVNEDKSSAGLTEEEIAAMDYWEITKPQYYIDAVDKQDFAQAHKILNRLYSEYIYAPGTRDVYWPAAHHIYKAEMMYLLPQNDPEANRRMLYTIQSMNPVGKEPIEGESYYGIDGYDDYCKYADQYNTLCLEIQKVAIRNDNEEMARQIAKYLLKGYKGEYEADGNHKKYTANTVAIDQAKQNLIDAYGE